MNSILESQESLSDFKKSINLVSNNIEEVKRYSEAITRQNHEQSRFISGCLHEIHVLRAKLACATTPEKRPNKNLLEKLLRL